MARRWPLLLLPPAILVIVAACGDDPPGSSPLAPDAAAEAASPIADASPLPPAPAPRDATADALPADASVDQDSGAITDAAPDVVTVPPTPTLLFDTPKPGAVGRRIVTRGALVFWLYDVGAKSFIATEDPAGARVDIVEADAIGAFDVRGVVAWTSNGHLFVREPSATVAVPTDLGPASCVALASTQSHVYCRGTDNTLVRWPFSGTQIDASVIASAVPVGPDIVTDDQFLYLSETQGNISRVPLGGFADAGAPVSPGYLVLAQNQVNPRELVVGVPGDSVLYWAVGNDGGTVRGASSERRERERGRPVPPRHADLCPLLAAGRCLRGAG